MNRGTLKREERRNKAEIHPKVIIVFIIQKTYNHYFTAFLEYFSARAA